MENRKVTYKIYPNKPQSDLLFGLLRSHQELYNAALQERIEAYRKHGKSISYADQCKSLTLIRAEIPEVAAFGASAQQMTLRRLNKAFSAFFSRVKRGQTAGFPRFKSLRRFSSVSFRQHGDGWKFHPGEDWKNGRLYLSGIGNIQVRGQARQGGEIKSSEVMWRNDAWYLSLTVAAESFAREAQPTQACGLDWGVQHLLTIVPENGDTIEIENPRWFRSSRVEGEALAQSVSRKKRGSGRWKRACKKLATFRSKTARKRLDHHHKLSAKLAEDYALVAIEKLQIKNMTRSAKGTEEKPGKQVRQKAGLNREVLDTAPALLYQLISYKVGETGSWFLETPTRKLKPSQRCPACWIVAKKTLAERQHNCPACKHAESRDAASARVNLRWAQEFAGQELACEG